jgi:hypothetical protein
MPLSRNYALNTHVYSAGVSAVFLADFFGSSTAGASTTGASTTGAGAAVSTVSGVFHGFDQVVM